MRKISLFLVAMSIFGQALVIPSAAQANIIEFFFPSLKKDDYDPTLSLQAPFADVEAQEQNPIAEGQLPENAVAMDKAHRVDSEIGDWVVMAISESMSFTAENFSDDLASTKQYFSTEGRQEYAEFLKNKSLLKVLQSKKYFIRNFVEDVPFTLNKGPVDGRYRWLFEVPIMLSYMDRNVKNYRNTEPISQKLVLTVQVGRVAEANNEYGILIERWDGKLKKVEK